MEIQYILGKINFCHDMIRQARMHSGNLDHVHKWEAELAQWRAKLEKAQNGH